MSLAIEDVTRAGGAQLLDENSHLLLQGNFFCRRDARRSRSFGAGHGIREGAPFDGEGIVVHSGLGPFSTLAFALDPLFHALGIEILTASVLEPLFTVLYNSTLWRLENFNDSIVAGSLFVSLVGFVPLLLGINAGVRRYRETLLEWFMRTRLMVFVKASRFYGVYQRVADVSALP